MWSSAMERRRSYDWNINLISIYFGCYRFSREYHVFCHGKYFFGLCYGFWCLVFFSKWHKAKLCQVNRYNVTKEPCQGGLSMIPDSTGSFSFREGFRKVISCDFCGNKKFFDIAVRADGMQVLECARCGLTFLAQLPDHDYLSSLYEESYFKKEDKAKIGYQDYGWTNISEIQSIFSFIIDIISKHTNLEGKRFLEVGCATGELLFLARQAGVIITGVEGSKWASEVAKQRFGLDIINTTLEEADLNQPLSMLSLPLRLLSTLLAHQCLWKS